MPKTKKHLPSIFLGKEWEWRSYEAVNEGEITDRSPLELLYKKRLPPCGYVFNRYRDWAADAIEPTFRDSYAVVEHLETREEAMEFVERWWRRFLWRCGGDFEKRGQTWLRKEPLEMAVSFSNIDHRLRVCNALDDILYGDRKPETLSLAEENAVVDDLNTCIDSYRRRIEIAYEREANPDVDSLDDAIYTLERAKSEILGGYLNSHSP